MKAQNKPFLHRDWIDPHAFGIVRTLQKAGFTTYLVGGCVRDLLLGTLPKDFDVATTARPEQVRKIIFRSFIIGKRFRLVLVKREPQQFEVATFRREQSEEEKASSNPISLGDNLFGTPEEDARRRDFTINGLFYDPLADQLIDYNHGQADLEQRIVRMIGHPDLRLVEDPIRILRALRLAHMIGFQLESQLRFSMEKHGKTLTSTALPRRREELLKLMRLKDPALAFQEAYDLGLLQHMTPHLHQLLEDPHKSEVFFRHLHHAHDVTVNKQNPLELFGLILLAYVRAQIQPDVSQPLKASEWTQHPELLPLMRDELGIFKFEQLLLAKALHMQSTLQKVDDFAKRGASRQLAVLKNEAFPLAFNLAQRDFALSPREILFWHQAFKEAHPQLSLSPESRPPRQRKRKRRLKK